jgi:hypothetical protein
MAKVQQKSLMVAWSLVAVGGERDEVHPGLLRGRGRISTTLSVVRHPSQSRPPADENPRLRQGPTDTVGVALAAVRAGRPGGSAGVLGSRGLAISARPAIHSRWLLGKGACFMTPFTTMRMLTRSGSDTFLAGCPQAYQQRPSQARERYSRPAGTKPCWVDGPRMYRQATRSA